MDNIIRLEVLSDFQQTTELWNSFKLIEHSMVSESPLKTAQSCAQNTAKHQGETLVVEAT